MSSTLESVPLPQKKNAGVGFRSAPRCLQPVQRRHHGGEDAHEQHRHLAHRVEVEVIGLVDRFAGGERRSSGRGQHQRLAQEGRLVHEDRAEDDGEEDQVCRP